MILKSLNLQQLCILSTTSVFESLLLAPSIMPPRAPTRRQPGNLGTSELPTVSTRSERTARWERRTQAQEDQANQTSSAPRCDGPEAGGDGLILAGVAGLMERAGASLLIIPLYGLS